jgi:hypothetical protein
MTRPSYELKDEDGLCLLCACAAPVIVPMTHTSARVIVNLFI